MSLSEDGQAAKKEYKVGYCFFTGDIISVECRRLVFDVNICVYGHATSPIYSGKSRRLSPNHNLNGCGE